MHARKERNPCDLEVVHVHAKFYQAKFNIKTDVAYLFL